MTTIANTEIEIFGQMVQVDASGFFSLNGESFRAIVPRGKTQGKRMNMSQILTTVRDMFQDGLTGSEIAKLLDKDSDTIGRYKKIIVAFGALDESAIIKKREDQAEFRNEQASEMLKRPEVKEWYDALIENKKAGKTTRAFVASLSRVCNILKLSPMALCQKEYVEKTRQLKEINSLMHIVEKEVKSESSFYVCRMAVRSWIQFNGVGIPRGNLCPANLSGKVVSTHGQASDVRASMDEIARAKAILGNPKSKLPYPERRIDTEIYFMFGVETASRMTAIITAKLDKWNPESRSIKTIERKLTHANKQRMSKRIFCPELIRIMNERKAAGEQCLIGKQNEYVTFSEMEKQRSDDLHITKKQTQAIREIHENLRAVYQQVGGNMADPYFTLKPSHSLRHIAAQYWLLKSEFDYGFVAKLGGWFTIDELKTSYGDMPPEVFDKKYSTYVNTDASTDAKRAKDPSSDKSGE